MTRTWYNQAWTPALSAIIRELERAESKFGPFHNTHEGYAVLLEEVDELWGAIKSNDKEHAKKEAVQVAAMALRFLLNLYEWEPEELESKLGAADRTSAVTAALPAESATGATAAPSVSVQRWFAKGLLFSGLGDPDTARACDLAAEITRIYESTQHLAYADHPQRVSQFTRVCLAFVRGEPLPQKGK